MFLQAIVFQVIVFTLGLILLILGAEWLVGGSSKFARSVGIKPIIIGLTFVAFGTSVPEAAVGIIAVLKGAKGIALGDVIGSNIANIGLVMGVAALISPLKVEMKLLKRELPIMIGAAILLYLIALDSKIGFLDGLLLLIGIILFTGFCFFVSRKRPELGEEFKRGAEGILRKKGQRAKSVVLATIGLAILLGGAYLMVESGVRIARIFGINEWVIGLTIFAIGTSLPELATSAVSAYRKKADIAIGTVIGSNIFNILFVIGIVSMISPLTVEASILRYELPIMLAFSLILFPLMKSGFVVTRFEGAILVAGYLGFILWLFLR